ncbi:hypothetical protein [Streptosporangium sp. NPDC051022]
MTVQLAGEAAVGLAVLEPDRMFFCRGVTQDEAGGDSRGGTWHWPEPA